MSIETVVIKIKKAVSEVTDVTIAEMEGKCRKRDIVEARHVSMYFIKLKLPGLALVKLGNMFGGRDHSSVIHAIESVFNLKEVDWRMKEVYKHVEAKLATVYLPKYTKQHCQELIGFEL